MDTMAMERSFCPFDKRRLTYALHGGEENVRLKEKFMTEFARGELVWIRLLFVIAMLTRGIPPDSRFRLDDLHELSLDQLRERTMAKVHSLLHFVTTEPLPEFQKRMELVGTLDPGFSTRCVVCRTGLPSCCGCASC
jgi:acyl-CoA oxidase